MAIELKKLGKNGFPNLKVGKVGMKGVFKGVYNELGYGAINDLLTNLYSSIPSIIGGVC